MQKVYKLQQLAEMIKLDESHTCQKRCIQPYKNGLNASSSKNLEAKD